LRQRPRSRPKSKQGLCGILSSEDGRQAPQRLNRTGPGAKGLARALPVVAEAFARALPDRPERRDHQALLRVVGEGLAADNGRLGLRRGVRDGRGSVQHVVVAAGVARDCGRAARNLRDGGRRGAQDLPVLRAFCAESKAVVRLLCGRAGPVDLVVCPLGHGLDGVAGEVRGEGALWCHRAFLVVLRLLVLLLLLVNILNGRSRLGERGKQGFSR